MATQTLRGRLRDQRLAERLLTLYILDHVISRRLLVSIAHAALLAFAACSQTAQRETRDPEPAPSKTGSLAGDAAELGDFYADSHVDLDALIASSEWTAAVGESARTIEGADRDSALVELMRLSALPGRTSGGDGHTGIFPLDSHRAPLHLYPIRLYWFPEGLYVVEALPDAEHLIGSKLLEIDGVPVDQAITRIEPLVPRDNEMTVKARLPQFLVTAEVLHGLGIAETATSASFSFDAGGGELSEELRPVDADAYAEALDVWHPMIPPSLPVIEGSTPGTDASSDQWAGLIDEGRILYVAYKATLGDSYDLGDRIERLAGRGSPLAVVLDLRHNPGGENGASQGLRDALATKAVRAHPLHVLIGRSTFSAAGYLSLHLERDLDPIFVGEPSGFSTLFIGDPTSKSLSSSGYVANAGTVLWDEGKDGAFSSPLRPDIARRITAKDYFGGLDPVLEAVRERTFKRS